MAFRKAVKGTLIGGGAVATAFGLSQLFEYRKNQARLAYVEAQGELKVPFKDALPTREEQLSTLRNTEEFDVLVVGGGATGSGCALDAVTRNLKTALVERSDFSSGTSSRSTKLIHGGVRYLQKAIMKLDYEQYMMVKEALHERQHNDARMNLAITLTAARHGAAIANYTEVVHLLKKPDPKTGQEKVCGAHCRDIITGQEFDIRAKCVINATGPFTDSLRKMDSQKTANICQPSAGVHIVIPGYYSPDNMGLLDPATSDGRVIFFLPWEKMTIAGTTDTPTEVTAHPIPVEDDINFILSEVRNYLSPDVEVRRGDVLAAWSGIRPLVTDPNSKNTQSICRNHIINISDSGLVTIAGGKWTTYRSMAEETLDAAIKAHKLSAGPSRTVGLMLDGGKDWTPTLYIRLVQDYGLENEVGFEAQLLRILPVRALWSRFSCSITLQSPMILWGRESLANPCLEEELEAAKKFLHLEMGYKARSEQLSKTTEISLTAQEIARYKKRFYKFDKESRGFITTVDVQQVLEKLSIQIDENALHEILNEVDLNKNGQVELDEFLQLMSAVQRGQISDSRLAILMKTAEEGLDLRGPVSVDRSGGGV
uniref:Glycerol-3-phosphate dehydrogenase, mitochondrial n=1 Tax=Sinocyclocheilus grahami TaxID=75366 RepID=A0A672NDC3_SINGR